MHRPYKLTFLGAALMLATTLPAHAYIGPGAGAGAIAVVLGILASIVLAFFAILWYPAKRLLKRRKATQSVEASSAGSSEKT